jgi:hypothetical protein
LTGGNFIRDILSALLGNLQITLRKKAGITPMQLL